MNAHSPIKNHLPSILDQLCDIVVNEKRDAKDFLSLLKHLKLTPKECIPFKGKILQHLKIHALGNPKIDHKLLSACFARTAILFRKTANKSEGPVGAWKSGLLEELNNLEENLDRLYQIIGVNYNNIISESSKGDKGDSNDELQPSNRKLNEKNSDYEVIINEYFIRIHWATHNVCTLISLDTDFDLPIPVLVLLRMASKIGAIRWKNFKKIPNGLLRNHVYSLTPYLIGLNMMLFRSLITILGTNIIPFTPFINQNLLRIFEWTRSSNLSRSDENSFHLIRSELFEMVSFMLEQLSLSINLEPQFLKALVEVELVDNLEDLIVRPLTCGSTTQVRDKHVIDALGCLENLFITYWELLDAPLEERLKSYVVKTCIKIYRDFGSKNTEWSLNCRRKLLQVLEMIANQPYATSTSEIAYHIFELAGKMESDSIIRSTIRKSLKIGLAHRPTIVSHYDVYNCYGRSILDVIELSSEKTGTAIPESEEMEAEGEEDEGTKMDSVSEGKSSHENANITVSNDNNTDTTLSTVINLETDSVVAREHQQSLPGKDAEDTDQTPSLIPEDLKDIENQPDGRENGESASVVQPEIAGNRDSHAPQTGEDQKETEFVSSLMKYFVEKLV